MTMTEFLIVYGCCFATILVCRVVPLFVLKGRELSASTQRALELIPPAAFAALVANDLFKPELFAAGLWDGCMPLIASIVVVAVALKTKNLLACVIVGVLAYVLLMMVGL
ncbi:MAG: AzlD domain-containing protein [Coriobacteriaceae bacterium]|nr:AzlD domain-containing protein [Coriobacteriaceae bacterium]